MSVSWWPGPAPLLSCSMLPGIELTPTTPNTLYPQVTLSQVLNCLLSICAQHVTDKTKYTHNLRHSFIQQQICVCVLRCVQLFVTPWTVAHQALLSMEFSQNTGEGYHFLLQGIFLTQGSNPHLLHLLHWQADSLALSQQIGNCQ